MSKNKLLIMISNLSQHPNYKKFKSMIYYRFTNIKIIKIPLPCINNINNKNEIMEKCFRVIRSVNNIIVSEKTSIKNTIIYLNDDIMLYPIIRKLLHENNFNNIYTITQNQINNISNDYTLVKYPIY